MKVKGEANGSLSRINYNYKCQLKKQIEMFYILILYFIYF